MSADASPNAPIASGGLLAGPRADRLTAAAIRAAEQWGYHSAAVTLISLSENAVFRVDGDDGSRRVLRLHRPGYNTRQEMQSELLWVEALREAGIDAPAPVRSLSGAGHVEVDIPSGIGPGDDYGVEPSRLAGMIEWVDGVNLEDLVEGPDRGPAEPGVAEHYARVGGLLAEIRMHGRTWDPPPGFTRRRWDANGLVGPDPLWGRFWEIPTDPAERALFETVRRTLHRQLSALPTGRVDFGLIHADLHQRNVLIDGDRTIAIDFDDAGFGWYVHEIAVALHPAVGEPWFDQAKQALVDGYRAVHPLPDTELALLPAFLAIRHLMLVSWLDARPELGLQAHLPRLIADAAEQAERLLGRRDRSI